MSPKVPLLRLNTGHDIPAFGLGTWQSKPGEVKTAVEDAIDVGYRHIDCAMAYGNESEVGEAIQNKIQDGVVKREDLFVVSKLWNTYHRPDLVPVAVKKSLTDLKLSYLDLYLIHWPMAYQEEGEMFPKDADGNFLFSDVDFVDTWKAMEECVKQGLIRSIGLSNFNSKQIQRIIDTGSIKPASLQVECHPYLNQARLIEFCKDKNIVVTGYSPLGSPERPWAKPTDPRLLDDPKLKQLGEKYKKTPAQILLRWNVQRGLVVIPKTVSKQRMIENISIFDFELSDEDMEYINGFDCNGRNLHLDWVKDHKYWPFRIDF